MVHTHKTAFESLVCTQKNDIVVINLSICDINIEDLINQDIQTIDNSGAKVLRERALRNYYSNPNYCKYCNKIILTEIGKKVRLTKDKQFCNHTCAATFNNNMRIDVKTGPISIVDACSDDDFIKAYNNSNDYKQLGLAIGYIFISTDIKNKLKKRMQKLGLDEYDISNKSIISTFTKGELISRRSNWQSWRSDIQKNARLIYQQSKKPNCCVVCEYDKTYEVAHIKAVSDFDDDTLVSEINSIDNLIALCPNHHWEFDHGQLDVNEYII